MDNLVKAMEVEKQVFANHTEYEELAEAIKEFGFTNLPDYFNKKREYLFNNWMPEIYYVDISVYAEVTEDAINTGKYGIYISNGEGIHAYHGIDAIDYDLCNSLGVRVVELNYVGGTIIGSADDLSIIMVFPRFMDMNHPTIINKIADIIGKYVPNVTVHNNDILVNNKKVSGSMTRYVGDSFVWAAQISFRDYSEYIAKICNKPSVKKPAYIDSSLLTRDKLEEEILAWLQKTDN